MDGETGEVLWSQHFASPSANNESLYSICADAQGNALITGRWYNGATHEDIVVMKLDAGDGHTLWQRLLDGPGHLDDRGWHVAVGADGGRPIVARQAKWRVG